MSETTTREAKVSKNEKLKELAARRVPAALHQINLLGNLAAYDPTPEQVNKIVNALRAAVKKVEDRLRGATHDEPEGFDL